MRRPTKFSYTAAMRFLLAAAASLLAFTLFASAQTAVDLSDPSTLHPTGFVNDYAGVIDASTKAALEAKLTELKKSTDPQVEIAVAIVRTTNGRDIFDYSLTLARNWKIGSQADDNPSALLFVAIDDRKYFTQVSRDLEDELPDGLVGSLQRQYLVPQFRQGNYSKGISDTVDAYISVIRDKGNVAGVPAGTPMGGKYDGERRTERGSDTLCCMGMGLLAFIFLLMYLSRKNSGGGGGSGGGGSVLPWVIGGVINSMLNSGSSGGSSSWGGSSGGSSGGWGGFGGGGDFGGGGAGGSW